MKFCSMEDKEGRCPAERFLSLLQSKARGKIAKWIEKLEELGPNLPRPYADIVRGKIRELRTVFASNQYRLLYFFYNRKIIITHGFLKKGRRVPEEDVRKAERIMADFEERIKKGEIRI